MTEEDRQPQQWSYVEQRRIMRDLEQSKRAAITENDESRQFYLNQIDND